MKTYRIPGVIGKPRMTQRDKWAKRPCVLRYREWCDAARAVIGRPAIPESVTISAHIQMPKSWGKKKRAEMNGKPHRQKPDIDNIIKSVLDALWEEDKRIHSVTASKWWTIEESYMDITLHAPLPESASEP